MALKFDVHSPNKIRVNVVLPQFDQFYTTYGVTEKDKMYIKPEDRLQIW
ncbi:putative metalloendopeptidase [Clostridium paraputrificum]